MISSSTHGSYRPLQKIYITKVCVHKCVRVQCGVLVLHCSYVCVCVCVCVCMYVVTVCDTLNEDLLSPNHRRKQTKGGGVGLI